MDIEKIYMVIITKNEHMYNTGIYYTVDILLSYEKILVTGSEGFIGSHLVESLLQNNYSVKALVLYNSFNSIGWLKNIKHKI